MGHISDRADRFVQKLLNRPSVEDQQKDSTPQQKVLQRIKRVRKQMSNQQRRM